MNKTKAQKYNENLDKIFTPEIERLKRVEKIADNILVSLDKVTEIDPCGLDRCHLINIISKNINHLIK